MRVFQEVVCEASMVIICMCMIYVQCRTTCLLYMLSDEFDTFKVLHKTWAKTLRRLEPCLTILAAY